MDNEKKILNALKKSGEPMRPGEIAEAAGVEKGEVSKVLGKLKKDGKVCSPKRCFYGLS
ncbi:MAG: winged helix-turn-helix transcriptional regulator [Candidatus Krumholzibacteria bacterium]|nr:winged helix-turn-helix transcriptional regulator [Candidatus Krumholzibacteria bacterium]